MDESGEIKEKILAYLRAVPNRWANASDIAANIGYNRITIGKYLEVLKATNQVVFKTDAQAKLWSIAGSKKKRILIAEDESHIVELIKLTLGPSDYEFIEAADGVAALSKVASHNPDIIILDLMMPLMGGYEVCKQLKQEESTQHIPIIIVTAKSEIEDKIKGINLGVDEYIVKPFDPLELEARVSSLLRNREFSTSANPISQLPGREACIEFLSSQKKQGEFAHIVIQNLAEFNSVCGYKRGHETVQLIARILLNAVKDDSTRRIFHYDTTQFIITAKNLDRKIRQAIKSFDDTLPFIYSNHEFEIKNDKKYVAKAKKDESPVLALALTYTIHANKSVSPPLLKKLELVR